MVWARVGKGEAIGHRETLHIVCLYTTNFAHQQHPSLIMELHLREEGKES